MHNLWKQMAMGMNMEGQRGQVAADAGEQVHISPLALVKMLKHGRAGVPMEVMGLMLGEFVNEYSIRVIDVFSMPQTGNNVSVEAVDPVYQTEMLEQLKRTGRSEMVVGWYHSHPGFGCWFSGTDVNTQQSFEQLNARAVGVVVDPIQSVRGKVVMDCFRLINTNTLMLNQEFRQTTSNLGYMNKPSGAALARGLNRSYYSININCRTTVHVDSVLKILTAPPWSQPLQPTGTRSEEGYKDAAGKMEDLSEHVASFRRDLEIEAGITEEKDDSKKIRNTNENRIVDTTCNELMAACISDTITTAATMHTFSMNHDNMDTKREITQMV